MNFTASLAAAATLIAVTGTAVAQQRDAEAATASLIDAKGNQIGTVEIQETRSGVIWLSASATGLPPGEHGFHIHEVGECDAAGGFESAGEHIAAGMEHGVLAEDGPHPGDLPNVWVSNNGKLQFETFTSALSVDAGWFDETGLFDDNGSAVVIHAQPDDYSSQPSGGAGDRIACGILEQQ